MLKIPVYFYEIGFGFLNINMSTYVVEPSPHPYLICAHGDVVTVYVPSMKQFQVTSFPTHLMSVFEKTITITPNLHLLPLEYFREAGLEHSLV